MHLIPTQQTKIQKRIPFSTTHTRSEVETRNFIHVEMSEQRSRALTSNLVACKVCLILKRQLPFRIRPSCLPASHVFSYMLRTPVSCIYSISERTAHRSGGFLCTRWLCALLERLYIAHTIMLASSRQILWGATERIYPIPIF